MGLLSFIKAIANRAWKKNIRSHTANYSENTPVKTTLKNSILQKRTALGKGTKMANFTFLQSIPEYALFATPAIEAERIFRTSPAMSAVASRKALELAVKWVYAADETMEMPYRDNLSSLVHEETFQSAVDPRTWAKLPYIIRLGNNAVHTGRRISAADAVTSLHDLFEFIQWVDYCYGSSYVERTFDENLIPKEKDAEADKALKALVDQKQSEIEALEERVRSMAEQLTKAKNINKASRAFNPTEISEFETRKRYIDLDLQYADWNLDGKEVVEELEVDNMLPGQKGYVDYVLMGKDGLPLAVVEAKKTSKDPMIGKKQAILYADALEKMTGRRPMIFLTNGFDTYFWDDLTGPDRPVSGIFSRNDLQRLMNRRTEIKDLSSISISNTITERYYQKEAITAVCENLKKGHRKNLLVMATGTGKTRTAASLVDVLSRGGAVTNVLFLADRTALVKQAKNAFQTYLENMSLCNLCTAKDDRNARIVFSTYPTILNCIDDTKEERLFTPAHFDLIIIDEAHRSIFKKYKTIFEYFDAILVGLTATPKTDVDRNTYDFFEMETGVPTYAYDYETAVYTDHVLVPYFTYAVTTKFTEEGIKYDDLTKEDRERLEEDFNAEGLDVPDFVPSAALNKFLFNEVTVDTVIQDLMERGIKVDGGNKIGKTIIFAQNKNHAQFIVDRFNKLYPEYKGKIAERVVCTDNYVQTTIDNFEISDSMPQVAVSVDMMDTGIDVPECVNLVFFKQVKSKTKFWQMIGRGTRLCPGILFTDKVDGCEYEGKRRFLIFDYCKNFEYFGMNGDGKEGKETRSLEESVFRKKIQIMADLQSAEYSGEDYQKWRKSLVDECVGQVQALKDQLASVRMRRAYVEKYKLKESYANLLDYQVGELISKVAPLVTSTDKDIMAKRFDNFAYGLIVAKLEGMKTYTHASEQMKNVCHLLEGLVAIPQVKAKLEVIQEVQTDEFWGEDGLLLRIDGARSDLRGLIQFMSGSVGKRNNIYTHIADPVIKNEESVTVGPGYDFADYRQKVNKYIGEHGDSTAIYKLTHNIPLRKGDFDELERVFTVELGNAEDYKKAFGDTPFGLLVRKTAKLDHEAAMQAFSKFIGDENLTQQQIQFVYKIINHIEINGYMEDLSDLTRAPFDKPVSFIKLFDYKRQAEIVKTINEITENAIIVQAG